MRLLMLTQIAPFPPDAGPKIKTYFLLKKLSMFHDIDLVTFARDEHEREAANALKHLCSNVTTISLERSRVREPLYAARGWASRQPFLVARDYRKEMMATVSRRVESGSIDVVHADQLSMAQYLPDRRRLPRGVYLVFDAHNAVWKLVQSLVGNQPTPVHRVAASIEWRMLKRFEGRACSISNLTLAVSPIDVSYLQQAAGGAGRYVIAPIGIEARETEQIPIRASKRRLLSISTMHYPPNIDAIRWFREFVWSQFTPAERSIGFDIVGSRPPADIISWASEDPHVKVHGFVPDLSPLLNNAGIFVVPLNAGSGIRVKILEAMAHGLPIVSTSIGVEGLPVVSGEHLLVADTPEAFANAIRRLMADPVQRRKVGTSGRSFAMDYDWRSCLQPVIEAYDHLSDPTMGSTNHMLQPDQNEQP